MLFASARANLWRFRGRSQAARTLHLIVALAFLSCALDALSCLANGRPGLFFYLLNVASNTWLYAMNVLMAPLWVVYLSAHVESRFSPLRRRLYGVVILAGLAGLVANLFVPLAFWVDEANVYHRGVLYGVYLAAAIGFLLDSVYLYWCARKQGGLLQFFPLSAFVVPFLLGAFTQTMFYGLSTIWPFVAISVFGLMAALQNEIIFHDSLTGLNNRFYLDHLKQELNAPGTHAPLAIC